MTVVTVENYEHIFPRIRESIQRAKFVAVDTEFSALYIHDAHKPSLFDSIEERYAKVRETVKLAKPLQVGLTAFEYNPGDGSYAGETFTFYTWPRPLLGFNPGITFKASSFQFLTNHNFDYNMLIYHGLPYMTKEEERWLSNRLKSFDFTSEFDQGHEDAVETVISHISTWYHTDKTNEQVFTIDLPDELQRDVEGVFLLHKNIRFRFGNKVWTEVDAAGKNITTRRVSNEEYIKLLKLEGLEEKLLNASLGFTKTFRLLVEAQKPLIGHNLFIDLLLLYNTFENPLPKSYKQFKQEIHRLFPAVYDTKSISFAMKKHLVGDETWKSGSLASLYVYFKDLHGRHVALNSPLIESRNVGTVDKQFHDAGWDSYCTGYVFIRMTHFLATRQYEKLSTARVFTSIEHFAAAAELKNQVNVIRCSISHIRLDHVDPVSTRPSWLLAQATGNKVLDISQVTSLLSSCGSVEVKSFNLKKALIAVDNYTSERQILRKFKEHCDFHITRYDQKVFKHSKFFKGFLWSGLLASSGVIMFLIHKTIKTN